MRRRGARRRHRGLGIPTAVVPIVVGVFRPAVVVPIVIDVFGMDHLAAPVGGAVLGTLGVRRGHVLALRRRVVVGRCWALWECAVAMSLPCADAWSLGIVGVWAANMLGNKTAAAIPRSLRIMNLLHPHVARAGYHPRGFDFLALKRPAWSPR